MAEGATFENPGRFVLTDFTPQSGFELDPGSKIVNYGSMELSTINIGPSSGEFINADGSTLTFKMSNFFTQSDLILPKTTLNGTIIFDSASFQFVVPSSNYVVDVCLT
jgi:hypothetical protein